MRNAKLGNHLNLRIFSKHQQGSSVNKTVHSVDIDWTWTTINETHARIVRFNNEQFRRFFFEKSSRGNHHLREKSGSGISTVPLQMNAKIYLPTYRHVCNFWMATRSLMYFSTRYGFTEKRKAQKPGLMFALASPKKQHKSKTQIKLGRKPRHNPATVSFLLLMYYI